MSPLSQSLNLGVIGPDFVGLASAAEFGEEFKIVSKVRLPASGTLKTIWRL